MQYLSKNSHIANERKPAEKRNVFVCSNGEDAARVFNYYKQYKLSIIENKLPINRVPYKTTYLKHKTEFDKLVKIFKKYNITVAPYLKFFIKDFYKSDKSIDEYLVNMLAISKYVDKLNIEKKRLKIYKWFMKSATNIASDCKELGYFTTKDYLRHLISSKKLAQYVISGKISIYYLAAIPKFNKIIKRLDQLSRDELKTLEERFEIYNTDINEAFLYVKSIKVNPLKLTDDLLYKFKNDQN